MVKRGPSVGLVSVGFYLIIFLCVAKSTASTNITDKPPSKRQTDSFVVSANYGVQSGNTNNLNTPIISTYESNSKSFYPYEAHANTSIQSQTVYEDTYLEPVPTPSAWRGSNYDTTYEGYERHLQNDPDIYVTNFGAPSATTQPYRPHTQTSTEDIIYATISNPSTQWYTTDTKQSQARADQIHDATEIFNDINKPNVNDLQQIISKIVKGATKVHQVVKVPAVYEIHLQEEAKPEGIKNFQVPLPAWTYPTVSSVAGTWNEPKWFKTKPGWTNKPLKQSWPKTTIRPWTNPRPWTKTWNLPSKIKYFSNKPTASSEPIYGKYSYPKPFSNNQWQSSNDIPWDSWSGSKHTNTKLPSAPVYYGSVSVPMTPGSTEVTFLNHNLDFNTFNHGGIPDFSWYNTKKKEIEGEGLYSGKRGYRRSDKYVPPAAKRKYGSRIQSRRMYSPFDGINYIIHVREKSNK